MITTDIDVVERQKRVQQRVAFQQCYAETEAAGGPTCNICEGTRFSDKGQRVGARCRTCGALERARVLGLHIQDIGITAGMRVLHLAPERSITKLFLDSDVDYVAADFNISDRFTFLPPEKLIQVNLCGDMTPLGKNYDMIVHSHVLEHLKCNYSVVLAKLNMLLKAGGRQLFQIPIHPGEYAEDFIPSPSPEAARARRALFGLGSHMRRFGRADLESTLGMLFDAKPYVCYDLAAQFGEQTLLRHCIPRIFWKGPSMVTVFDIKKEQFRFAPV